jgi:hypothetical protein
MAHLLAFFGTSPIPMKRIVPRSFGVCCGWCSGAQARFHFGGLMAWLKPCPFTFSCLRQDGSPVGILRHIADTDEADCPAKFRRSLRLVLRGSSPFLFWRVDGMAESHATSPFRTEG